MHAGIVMTGNEAGDLERAVIGELPDDLAGRSSGKPDCVGVVMFHVREFFHHGLVLHDFVFLIEHEFVVEFYRRFLMEKTMV